MSGLLIENCRVLGTKVASVYCEGGRIAELSTSPSQRVPAGTEVMDANGGSLFPGFIDTHCHPFGFGWLKRNVDLQGTTNMTGVRLRLQARIQRTKPGEWVIGMGWDQETFPGRAMPSRHDIDEISGANPVALTRVCGHITLLNSKAIEALGFQAKSGVEYERDADGILTGIVKEDALTEVYGHLPRSTETSAADLLAVESEAARYGLTTLHSIVSSDGYKEELEALALLLAEGSLSLQYRVFIPPEAIGHVEERGLKTRLVGKVRVNGVKIYTDGSLGARTAALREPYSDDPGNTGLLRYKDEELADLVSRVDSLGYQVIIHAIGDRAVDQAIYALGRVTGAKNERRHRIEHASLLPKDLRSKMVKYGIRATVQPLFITSDTWARDRLGEERERDLYPLASMRSEGILASGSSDSPIESISPVLGIWASMTRGGGNPSEALSLDQGISLYTNNAASNGFDEGDYGIREGSPANLTLLDSEVSEMHPALLRKVGVLATVVGGNLVHSYGAG